MPSLTTQANLRRVQDPGFCYLCGAAWSHGEELDRDHVPPKRLFAEEDRTPPLILRTHACCNNGESNYDEQIGQLVSLLWKESPSTRDVSSLRFDRHAPAGMTPFGTVEYLDLQCIIKRWVMGFHAALYGEYLAWDDGAIFEPLPGGDQPGVDTRLHWMHGHIPSVIKRSRAVGRVDSIIAFNGKCRYECTWMHLDDGRIVCNWALDLYGWHTLGDINNFPVRSCVGWYRTQNDPPECASTAPQIDVPFRNMEPFNPFERQRCER